MKFQHLKCGREGARTLVLSSGLGGSKGYWSPHLELLSSTFDLLLYDQRGTGDNPEKLGPTNIKAMADDVLEVADLAGVEQFDLMGHAIGGLIGFDIACRGNSPLERLVAINAWPQIDAHTARCFEIRLATLDAMGLEAFAKLQMNFLYPPYWIASHMEKIAGEEAHAVAHFQGADNIRNRIGAARDFRLDDWPAGSKTEVLLVATTDDALVDVAQSHRLAAMIPGAKLIEYPQGGHAVNLTHQAAFDADVMAFLDRA